jgi:hypothetical protein
VGCDFSGREPFRAQRQHDLIHTRQPALPFLHDLRIERRSGVPRHVDLHRPDLGQYGLGAGAVAGVPAPAPGHVVPFVSEVFVHLRFQGGLQDVLRQPVQQPVRADELDALRPGPGQELLR